MSPRPTTRTLAGPLVFVALTLALTWTSAWLLGAASATTGPVATRLLRASLVYVAAVGWQFAKLDLSWITATPPLCGVFVALNPCPLLPPGEGENKSLAMRERDLG